MPFDDATRLAYGEVLSDERGQTAGGSAISSPNSELTDGLELQLICPPLCQVGTVKRAALLPARMVWSLRLGAGLGVGVASLMMRGLDTPGPGFVLPACAL